MYNVEQIEQLAQRYKETAEDSDFEHVFLAVDSLVDVLLGRKYSSIKHEWEDMKQEVLMKLWANRKTLCFTKSEKLYRFLHEQIRYNLNRAAKKIQGTRKNEDDLLELAEVRVKKYYIDDKDRDD